MVLLAREKERGQLATSHSSMRESCHRVWVLFVLTLSFAACISGIDKVGSILGYKAGVVTTQGGAFRIGELGTEWQRHKVDIRALVFQNQHDGATITVDSWCRGTFDDGPLSGLVDQIFQGYPGAKTISTRSFMLDGRAALQKSVSAFVDGAPVYMNLVVLKMNGCVYDFVYVASPHPKASEQSFDTLVRGFHYLRGPDVL